MGLLSKITGGSKKDKAPKKNNKKAKKNKKKQKDYIALLRLQPVVEASLFDELNKDLLAADQPYVAQDDNNNLIYLIALTNDLIAETNLKDHLGDLKTAIDLSNKGTGDREGAIYNATFANDIKPASRKREDEKVVFLPTVNTLNTLQEIVDPDQKFAIVSLPSDISTSNIDDYYSDLKVNAFTVGEDDKLLTATITDFEDFVKVNSAPDAEVEDDEPELDVDPVPKDNDEPEISDMPDLEDEDDVPDLENNDDDMSDLGDIGSSEPNEDLPDLNDFDFDEDDVQPGLPSQENKDDSSDDVDLNDLDETLNTTDKSDNDDDLPSLDDDLPELDDLPDLDGNNSEETDDSDENEPESNADDTTRELTDDDLPGLNDDLPDLNDDLGGLPDLDGNESEATDNESDEPSDSDEPAEDSNADDDLPDLNNLNDSLSSDEDTSEADSQASSEATNEPNEASSTVEDSLAAQANIDDSDLNDLENDDLPNITSEDMFKAPVEPSSVTVDTPTIAAPATENANTQSDVPAIQNDGDTIVIDLNNADQAFDDSKDDDRQVSDDAKAAIDKFKERYAKRIDDVLNGIKPMSFSLDPNIDYDQELVARKQSYNDSLRNEADRAKSELKSKIMNQIDDLLRDVTDMSRFSAVYPRVDEELRRKFVNEKLIKKEIEASYAEINQRYEQERQDMIQEAIREAEDKFQKERVPERDHELEKVQNNVRSDHENQYTMAVEDVLKQQREAQTPLIDDEVSQMLLNASDDVTKANDNIRANARVYTDELIRFKDRQSALRNIAPQPETPKTNDPTQLSQQLQAERLQSQHREQTQNERIQDLLKQLENSKREAEAARNASKATQDEFDALQSQNIKYRQEAMSAKTQAAEVSNHNQRLLDELANIKSHASQGTGFGAPTPDPEPVVSSPEAKIDQVNPSVKPDTPTHKSPSKDRDGDDFPSFG